MQKVWDWYAIGNNAKRVEILCARMGREDTGEAIDALIANGEKWIAQHDPDRASLSTHLLVQIGFALRDKSKRTGEVQFATNQTLENRSIGCKKANCQEIADALSCALNKLSAYDKWLILAVNVHGLNFTDLATALGTSKGTTRTHYLRAIERVREYGYELPAGVCEP